MAEVAIFHNILYNKHTKMVVKNVKMDASYEHTPAWPSSVVVKLDLCVKRFTHLQFVDLHAIPWNIESTEPVILNQLCEFPVIYAVTSLTDILSSIALIPREFLNATVFTISNYVLKSTYPREVVIHIKANLSVRNTITTMQRPPLQLRRNLVRVDDSMVVSPTQTLSMSDLKAKYGIVEAEDGDCCICLEQLSSCDVLKFPCCHIFHCKCIFQWFQHTQSCPLCRSIIA